MTIEEVGRETVIAHNDPSPARERVLRVYERRHAPINIQIALPSLDGIKRAVEMGLGVAVLPRRCALSEIARGHLVAVKVPELSSPRSIRFVFRKTGELSRAAAAFLEMVRARAGGGEVNGDHNEATKLTKTHEAFFSSSSLIFAAHRPLSRYSQRQRHVRQARRDRLHFLEPIQQQAGRVPRAVEKRFARRRRERRSRRVAPPATRACDRDRRRSRWPDRASTSCISASQCRGVRRHARHAERDGVAEEDLGERLADDRANAACGGSPAARARATSRSRSCALTSRIDAPA